MKIHIIMHESFEAPGAILEWARKKSHELSYTRVYHNEELPDNSDSFDFLMIMGGPQSPATTTSDCPHFNASAEINLIKKAIEADKLVLGVCLGAQLIGEAYGAPFSASPNKEIGVFDVTLTEDGMNDPIFKNFPKVFPVGHWHGDMPGLSKNSAVLAYSTGCPRQIVRYSPKVYGFQCHFEFTKEAIAGMIEHCGEEVEQAKLLPYVQDKATLLNHNYSAINQLLFDFLDALEAMHRGMLNLRA